jgi:hypothetical protein
VVVASLARSDVLPGWSSNPTEPLTGSTVAIHRHPALP